MTQQENQNTNNKLKGVREADRHVEAVINALKILDLFEKIDKLRLKDIVQKTSLNKSRVIRLCGTLIAMGYLIYSKHDSTYTLGTRILLLGKAYHKNNPLYSIAKPIVEGLAKITKETGSLFIIDNLQRLCLLRVEGTQPIRYSVTEGARTELYHGASSKILLAFADKAMINEVCQQLADATPDQNPRDSIRQLLDDLRRIKQLKFACSEGEITPNLCALSCPVFDYNGSVCAAMTVTGPTYRFSAEKKNELFCHLKKAAQDCSRSLGYEGDEILHIADRPF